MNTNRYCERLAIPRPAVEHFIGRHDTSLLRPIVLALLEHGGPLSMEEIADRLLDAGVHAPSGDMVRSLRKAWHGLPPVIKEPDGTMGLDLESWELKHLAWELGRETKPAADAAPAPPAVEMPGDDVPLHEEEVRDALASEPGLSNVRTAAAVLDLHGDSVAFAKIKETVERLSGKEWRPHRPFARSRLFSESSDGVLRPGEPSELRTLRRVVRAAARQVRELRDRQDHQARARAARQQAREEQHRREAVEASRLRKGLAWSLPRGARPVVVSILDLRSREIRSLTRRDALTWITRYDALWHVPGRPLWDMLLRGKAGDDPRMLFDWHSGTFCTCPDGCEGKTPEQRANPSMASWTNPHYLDEQRRRLPAYKFRRLHLNIGGQPEGAFLSAEPILAAVVDGRRQSKREEGVRYAGFVDMSGGSSDDAVLAIGHRGADGRAVLDLIEKQAGAAPFNPRQAVEKFCSILKEWGLAAVTGDAYAGQTFRLDFEERGVTYSVTDKSASALYEGLEPRLNAGEVELLDVPVLVEQLSGLVIRGGKVTHPAGEHDDFAVAASGAVSLVTEAADAPGMLVFDEDAGRYVDVLEEKVPWWDGPGVTTFGAE